MRNRTAFRFVLIIGIVNLFADLTYEGVSVVLQLAALPILFVANKKR
jgi:hypothetical protein